VAGVFCAPDEEAEDIIFIFLHFILTVLGGADILMQAN